MAFSGPAEVVQALYEESVNGSDVSGYCVGPLAEHLRLQHLATREVEAAAQSFEIRRLDVIESDAERAVVAIDGTYSFAERYPGTEWSARGGRVRHRVQLARVAGEWKVQDLRAKGRSSLRRISRAVSPSRDGDLELEATATASREGEVHVPVVTNRSHEPLELVRLTRTLSFLGLPFRTELPRMAEHRRLEPGESWGGRYVWNTPYRTRSTVLEAEALDVAGKTHRARVEIAPARPELVIRLGRLLSWPRSFEAVAFTIGALQPDWTVSPLLIGGALLVAGAMRVPYVVYFWRQKARGPGVVVAAALAAAEFAGGLLLVLWGDRSWTRVAIVATALFIVGQAGLRMQAQSTAPK